MDKMTLAFAVCLVGLCGAFGVIFVAHQWPSEVDGYRFSPEVAVALEQPGH